MKLEKILVCLFVIGVIMKFTNTPMAGMMMTISALTLSFLYLVFSWRVLPEKEERKKRMAISIVIGILFCQPPLGILFKLQYWPGAAIMLLVSLLYCSILLLVALLKYRDADAAGKRYFSGIIGRTIVFGVLCSILYITPSRTLLRLQYRHNPQEAEIRANYYEQPKNEEYREQFMEMEKKRR